MVLKDSCTVFSANFISTPLSHANSTPHLINLPLNFLTVFVTKANSGHMHFDNSTITARVGFFFSGEGGGGGVVVVQISGN